MAEGEVLVTLLPRRATLRLIRPPAPPRRPAIRPPLVRSGTHSATAVLIGRKLTPSTRKTMPRVIDR